ncbi:Asp23/Gls24 family envelope stress response protein [Streptomyces sp. NPDC014861]|uniref:Asp23/Gls24 family envelope stress response protein n=1 Tax=Streptomyces sp. NPDC014861 TaxID=3364923 RepID=UPI0037020A11
MSTPPPRGNPDDEDLELLACGRDLAAVWEQASLAPADDLHTLTCAYCSQAVADLERLRAAALPFATGTPPADLDTSALVQRVMDVVRLELRPGRDLPLGESDEDSWIYESVAARTLRAAAEEVPGVRAGSCRVTPQGSRVSPGRGPVGVRIAITVEYGRDLRSTTEAVREGLARAARERIGLAVSAFDVMVTDLHDPHDRPREHRT